MLDAVTDPELALILCRTAIFGSSLMIWGASVFRWRLLPGANRMPFENWSVIVLVVAVVVLLPVQTARIAGEWSDVGNPELARDVITLTTPGRAWTLQAAAAILVAFSFVMRWVRVTLFSALLVFIGQSMTGHAAASEGVAGLLRQANDVIHMMAAGSWLGALPFVVGLLTSLDRRETRAVLIRYSGEGHVWVSIVLFTGLIATLWIFDKIPLDWSVRYQFLWALKVFVTLVMAGLAIRNRYVLVPRLRDDPTSLTAIARATKTEVALGFAAVALVAWFGVLEPR